MPSSKVAFEGSSGDRLAAVLETPADGPARGHALFAHCFTCTKDVLSARHVTAGLARRGIAVLRFDFTGLGASEGEFSNTNFTSNVQDLALAARFMESGSMAPMMLVGHSLGGAAVLVAAREVPSARLVATIGAPADPAHVRLLFTGAQREIEEKGEAEVLLSGRPFRIRRQFLDDISSVRMEGHVRDLGKELVIFHSVADKTVDIENARRLYGMARHPKSFVSLDRADHLLGDRRDAEFVSEILAAWAVRHLGDGDDRPRA